MVQQNRSGSNRVTGTSAKNSGSREIRATSKGMTPDQIAQRDAATQAAYEVWRSEREARKAARYNALRSRNLGR